MTSTDLRQFAQEVIQTEASAVASMRQAIDDAFEKAVRLIIDCPGSVLCTGMGKAGHIARKISATLASTGTPSHFLSAADAVHGDLGAIRKGDVVLILSASGESDEIVRLMNLVQKLNHPVIAMTATPHSSLGKFADITLLTGKIEEACPLGLAPSASTTAMLALGDALALTIMKVRDFTSEDYAVFHPGGQLGRKLIKVREAMTFVLGKNLPVASDSLSVAQVLHEVSTIKRRSGAVVLTDAAGKLSGIFTDSDLRRLLTDPNGASLLERPIAQVMTRNPRRVTGDELATKAMAIMMQYRIDELPVVDDEGNPTGLIDVQDLIMLKILDVIPENG